MSTDLRCEFFLSPTGYIPVIMLGNRVNLSTHWFAHVPGALEILDKLFAEQCRGARDNGPLMLKIDFPIAFTEASRYFCYPENVWTIIGLVKLHNPNLTRGLLYDQMLQFAVEKIDAHRAAAYVTQIEQLSKLTQKLADGDTLRTVKRRRRDVSAVVNALQKLADDIGDDESDTSASPNQPPPSSASD